MNPQIAAVATMPFDVAKTMQQVDLAGMAGPKLGMVTVMRRVVVEEGWRGLFKGLSPRIAKVAPACAVMISSKFSVNIGLHSPMAVSVSFFFFLIV